MGSASSLGDLALPNNLVNKQEILGELVDFFCFSLAIPYIAQSDIGDFYVKT